MSISQSAPSMRSQRMAASALERMKEGAVARMNTDNNPYPFTAYARDPRDRRWAELQKHITQSNVAPMYMLREEDLEYTIAQQDQEEQLEFDIWCWNTYDMSNPAIREWFRTNIDPGMYDRMLAYVDKSIENTQRFTKINLMGPRSKEDLMFAYAAARGDIHIPRSFDPTEMDKPLPSSNRGDVDGFDASKLGVFNPLRRVLPEAENFGYDRKRQYNIFQQPTRVPDLSGNFPVYKRATLKGARTETRLQVVPTGPTPPTTAPPQ